jgi:CrcB protein
MFNSVLAIGIGAALGAVARWCLGLALNSVLPTLLLGTLAANWIGGLLMGVALAWFAAHGNLSPQWQLLCITGFLGGLTTFSAFSGEVTLLLRDGRIGWALINIAAHVLGSLLLTGVGLLSYGWLRRG